MVTGLWLNHNPQSFKVQNLHRIMVKKILIQKGPHGKIQRMFSMILESPINQSTLNFMKSRILIGQFSIFVGSTDHHEFRGGHRGGFRPGDLHGRERHARGQRPLETEALASAAGDTVNGEEEFSWKNGAAGWCPQ